MYACVRVCVRVCVRARARVCVFGKEEFGSAADIVPVEQRMLHRRIAVNCLSFDPEINLCEDVSQPCGPANWFLLDTAYSWHHQKLREKKPKQNRRYCRSSKPTGLR